MSSFKNSERLGRFRETRIFDIKNDLKNHNILSNCHNNEINIY